MALSIGYYIVQYSNIWVLKFHTQTMKLRNWIGTFKSRTYQLFDEMCCFEGILKEILHILASYRLIRSQILTLGSRSFQKHQSYVLACLKTAYEWAEVIWKWPHPLQLHTWRNLIFKLDLGEIPLWKIAWFSNKILPRATILPRMALSMGYYLVQYSNICVIKR